MEQYRGRFEEEERFLIIQSEEISDQYDNKPIHMNATNIQEKIDPQGGNSVAEVIQNNIDAVLHQREKMNIPMIPHVNHPNFGYALEVQDMIALEGEQFFEVYNGHPMVHNMGDSTRISTEEMWDIINIAYLSAGKPIMYGLATDDAHHYHIQGKTWSNAGRGWIQVRSDSLNPASIIAAMEHGDFYSSTGVQLKDISFINNILKVSVAAEKDVKYTFQFIGTFKDKTSPQHLSTIQGDHASFEVSEEMFFVRCKIISNKMHQNPIEDLIYETAWTQPVQYKN